MTKNALLSAFIAGSLGVFQPDMGHTEEIGGNYYEKFGRKIVYQVWPEDLDLRNKMQHADKMEYLDHEAIPSRIVDTDMIFFVLDGWSDYENIPIKYASLMSVFQKLEEQTQIPNSPRRVFDIILTLHNGERKPLRLVFNNTQYFKEVHMVGDCFGGVIYAGSIFTGTRPYMTEIGCWD